MAETRPAGCPPWCTRAHTSVLPGVHSVIVGGYGLSAAETQVTVEQIEPAEPTLNVWALLRGEGDSGNVKLSARDARVLARALDRVPPGEVADFVRALTDAAAVLDSQAGGDTAVTS
jgi:hypothetical protein